MEPSVTAAQQAAIASLRGRYERGEISYDALREGLDRIVAAGSAEECDTILRELPASPAASLAALDPPARAATLIQSQAIVAVMGQTKKLRRPWVLRPEAHVTAFMGEIKLDLGRAMLPPRARIHVRAVMADVTLYVPSSVAVSVYSRVFFGEAVSLGETANGIVASSYEEHTPVEGEPTAHIEIDVLCGDERRQGRANRRRAARAAGRAGARRAGRCHRRLPPRAATGDSTAKR